MIAALLLLAGSLGAGVAWLRDVKNNAVWGVLAGSVLGITAVFATAWAFGLNEITVAIAGTALLALAAWRWKNGGIRVALEKSTLALAVFAMVFFAVVGVLLFHVADVPRGVRIDFGFHQSIVTSMANGNFPPQHPLLDNEPLRYYYGPHLFSAALMAGGMDVQWATGLPFALWNAALVVGVFLLARKLAGGSWKIAALAVLLFFLNGTFAFIPYLQTHDVLGQFGAFLQNPGFLSDYRDAGFPFENVLAAQDFFTRSFALGFGILVLLVFGLLEKWDLKKMGVLAGLLPMVHLPSFGLWLLFAVPYVLLFDRRKEWLGHFALAGGLALPALLFLLGSPATSGVRLHLGWMAPDASPMGLVVFWLGNLGLFAALAAWALWKKPSSPLGHMTLCAVPAFVLANAVLVAPNAWDNVKLLLLLFLFLAIGAAQALADAWKKSAAFKAAALVLLVLMTLTGVLHAATVLAHTGNELYSANDWAACQWVDGHVAKDTLLLTDGTQTCAFALQGRRVIVGPLEWLENHGLDYRQRLADNDAMLAGNCAVLKRYGNPYFYDGGYLGRGATVNRTFWQSQETAYDRQGVTIYKPKCA